LLTSPLTVYPKVVKKSATLLGFVPTTCFFFEARRDVESQKEDSTQHLGYVRVWSGAHSIYEGLIAVGEKLGRMLSSEESLPSLGCGTLGFGP
jgi:hypothetical protein